MFKNSPSTCYTFFAIDDVIVTSVNTYTSMMGISIEDYLIKSLPENKKLECGPMPNLMVALPNIGGALCSTPQSLADAHY